MKEWLICTHYSITATLVNGRDVGATFSDEVTVVYKATCTTKQVENFQAAHAIKNVRNANNVFQLERIVKESNKRLTDEELKGATYSLALIGVVAFPVVVK